MDPPIILGESTKHCEEEEKELDFTDQAESPVKNWKFFGHNVPKPEIIFFSQVVIIYIVVITALVNITIANGNSTIWISLLCSCLGYMLPNPSLPSDNLHSSINEPSEN